jgi:hypothetical protein
MAAKRGAKCLPVAARVRAESAAYDNQGRIQRVGDQRHMDSKFGRGFVNRGALDSGSLSGFSADGNRAVLCTA